MSNFGDMIELHIDVTQFYRARDMIRMANNLDVLILVSGDGDYLDVVEYLQNQGALIEIVAFSKSASRRLIERADDFLDLEKSKSRFLIKSR